jgi:hypothetical protein
MRPPYTHRVLVAVVLVGALVSASAASLGVTSRRLMAFSDPNTVAAPPVISCDNFARPTVRGNQLDGRPVQLPAACGTSTWQINTGTWRITGGRADASGANATATIPAGRTEVSVEASFINGNNASRVGGVTLAHSGGTSPRFLAVALAGPNGVQIRISNGTTVTTIATATATYGSPARLRATLKAGVVTVSVNGVVVLTHTLSAANLALINGNTRAGLYDDQGSMKFDDFLLTEAWPP